MRFCLYRRRVLYELRISYSLNNMQTNFITWREVLKYLRGEFEQIKKAIVFIKYHNF